MQIETISVQSWELTHPGGNSTDTTFPSRINTTTNPTKRAIAGGIQGIGDGVIPFGSQDGMMCCANLMLLPIGVGSSTNTMNLQILGWAPTKFNIIGSAPLWIPTVIATFQATLGTGAGVANADLGTTTLFATTITCSFGPTGVTTAYGPYISNSFGQFSPGSNLQGFIIVPSLGFRYLEVVLNTNSSATSVNCLYRRL